jgi:hypothetical protein
MYQPTVLFDGLKEDSVSSSWGKDEWEKFLSYVLRDSALKADTRREKLNA